MTNTKHRKTPSNYALDVCGKKTSEYVIEILSMFNRGITTLDLRALAGNISKGIEIARILSSEFNVKIDSIEFFPIEINEVKSSSLRIILRYKDASQIRDSLDYLSEIKTSDFTFIEFPIYHLLLDAFLFKEGSLEISTGKNFLEDINKKEIAKGSIEIPLVIVNLEGKTGIRCKSRIEEDRDQRNIVKLAALKYEQILRAELLRMLNFVYYRCGFLLSPNWKKIAEQFCHFDDIILGIDTNILQHAVLSEHLFTSLSLINLKEYVSTPNWLFIIISKAVMYEVEQAANIREKNGYLKQKGRMGFRSLQELLELDQNTSDFPGVSLTIVGEANPSLDIGTEIRELRKNILKEKVSSFSSISSGDAIIRDQFKSFIRAIDFHKGIYFLTADKSNAALARAEGLHSVYYKNPSPAEAKKELCFPAVPCRIGGKDEKITLNVPLGKLIYELAVQFGSIKVKGAKTNGIIELRCDRKGENLDHWIYRDLEVRTNRFFLKLLKDYRSIGKFSLSRVKEMWKHFKEVD